MRVGNTQGTRNRSPRGGFLRRSQVAGRDGEARADRGVAELAVPGHEDRLSGAEREGAREMERVVATQRVLVCELAGVPGERFVDAEGRQFRVQCVELGHRSGVGASSQPLRPARRGQRGTRLGVGEDTGGGRIALPQLGCDIRPVLDDDQLDQRRGVQVQPQRRCSDTNSDTDPRAATLARR